MGTSKRSPAPRTKSKRGATIRWSYELRLALHILKTDQARLSAKEHTRVFNKLFHEHLTDCGLSTGASPRCLTAQWLDRRNKDWARIEEAEKTQADQLRRLALKERIRKATIELERLSLTPSGPVDEGARDSTLCPPKSGIQQARLRKSGLRTRPSISPQSAASIRLQTSNEAQHPMFPADCEFPTTPSSVKTRATTDPNNEMLSAGPSTPHHPVVAIPSSPEVKTSPSGKTVIRYTRADGHTLYLTPKKFEKAQRPLTPVIDWRAHPDTIQFTGLLFRFWEKRYPPDHDSEQGFWSRRHFGKDIVPNGAPFAGQIDAADVKTHLNRDLRDTPFISTTNRLVWSIRNTLQRLKQGVNIYMSIIERQRLNPKQVFYARPYHDQVVVKAVFTDGAQRYHGTYEFWVWANIPASAIVRTISARELLHSIEADKDMAAIFRPRRLMSTSQLENQRKSLAADKLSFSDTVVSAIAKLILLLKINPTSTDNVCHIVRDVIEGWGIDVAYNAPDLWVSRAREFLHMLTKKIDKPYDLIDEQRIKSAFLEGVKFGVAKPNVAHTQVKQLQNKWEAIGLTSAASIIEFEHKALRAAMRGLATAESKNINQIVTHANKIAEAAATPEQRNEMAFLSERHQKPRRSSDVLQSDIYDANAASDIESLDWRDAIIHTM